MVEATLEKIWGRLEYPTSGEYWTSIAPAYPNRADIPSSGGKPNDLPEPDCEGPTSCSTKRLTHESHCGAVRVDGGIGNAVDAGNLSEAGAGGAYPDESTSTVGTPPHADPNNNSEDGGCAVGPARRSTGPGDGRAALVLVLLSSVLPRGAWQRRSP